MNGEEKKGLSPSDYDLKGKVVLTTDQSTLGKILGVAEGSARALGKDAAFSAPNFAGPKTEVEPDRAVNATPEQSSMLEGAVPVYENVAKPTDGELSTSRDKLLGYPYGLGKARTVEEPIVETVETVGGIILGNEAPTDLVTEPVRTHRDILLDGYETVASAQAKAAEVPAEVVSSDKPALTSRDILLGNTGAIQQEPLNEGEGTIVLENPATGETTGLPEPEHQDASVQLEEDKFNVASSIPEDGKNINNNPNLDPKGPDDGLVIDLPNYTGVQEKATETPAKVSAVNDNKGTIYHNTVAEAIIPDSVTAIDSSAFTSKEETQVERALRMAKEKFTKAVNQFMLECGIAVGISMNQNNSNDEKATTDILDTVDTTVADGLRKIQDAVGAPMIAPLADEEVVAPDQEGVQVL